MDLAKIAHAVLHGNIKNVIVLTGAGISVPAGIPDFRSPTTGLYAKLQRYQLPDPTSIFELSYYRQRPEAFCELAKELYPTRYTPTRTHHFIRLLHEKGVLLRNYTQNIDDLELLADVPPEKVVQCHGGFSAASCIECGRPCDIAEVRDTIFANRVPRCATCQGLVKPDIVFFGEQLPPRFFECRREDFSKCDLLIVMGTSLKVYPVADLVIAVAPNVPRLLINNEIVGDKKARVQDMHDYKQLIASSEAMSRDEFATAVMRLNDINQRRLDFQSTDRRDVLCLKSCDEGVQELTNLLHWQDDLEELVQHGYRGTTSL